MLQFRYNKNMLTYILVGTSALLVVGVGLWVVLRKSSTTQAPRTQNESSNTPIKVITKDSGVKIETLKLGNGSHAADRGDLVSVHYTGWLTTGQKFDSSVDRGTPFEFKLGQGKVIQGWEEGIRGMKVGEKRRLTVPPKSGYGSRGTGRIPPRATLIFEVELMSVR